MIKFISSLYRKIYRYFFKKSSLSYHETTTIGEIEDIDEKDGYADTETDDTEENQDEDNNRRDKKEEAKRASKQARLNKKQSKTKEKSIDPWGLRTSERNLNREIGGLEIDYEGLRILNEQIIANNLAHLKPRGKKGLKLNDLNDNGFDDKFEDTSAQKVYKRAVLYKKLKKVFKGILGRKAIKMMSKKMAGKNFGIGKIVKTAKKQKNSHVKALKQARKAALRRKNNGRIF